MAGNDPTPPKKAKPAPVARDSVVNFLKSTDVYVLEQKNAPANDEFHLVPARKGTKKKEPKPVRVSVIDDRVAIYFEDPVHTPTFTYDLVHARVGKVRNVVLANFPVGQLPRVGTNAPKDREVRKNRELHMDEDETADGDLLHEARTNPLTLIVAEPTY